MYFENTAEQTAIVYRYNINSVFITEKESVYCAVGTKRLNVFQVIRNIQTVKLLIFSNIFSPL
jgi:hypothetical protein